MENKKTNYYKIMLVLILAILILSKMGSVFSQEKWNNKPDSRTKIVDSLIKKEDLVGRSENDIIELLGEDGREAKTFKNENNLVYDLGIERAFISERNEYLVIDFEDGRVVSFEIKRARDRGI